MLVNVRFDRGNNERIPKGEMHFAGIPRINDLVEIDGSLCVVTMVLHIPSIFFAGAKIRILVQQEISSNHEGHTLVKEGVEA